MTTEKKTRTPRTVDSITAGALSLTLSDRITLCKKLKEAIQAELRVLELNAKNAAEAAKDL